jgi:hypothetical protein
MAETNVYIDGFNLYHGLKELAAHQTTPLQWKWLDIHSLAQRLAPADSIQRLRYFTARVASPGHDPGLQQRQQTYLRALSTLPGLTIHLGQFSVQKKRMPLVDTPNRLAAALIRRLGLTLRAHPDGNTTVSVWKTEEKGSDVNLATWLVADAFRGDFARAIVVSNDTDLCEPVRLVAQELGLPVMVVNPRGHRNPAAALKKVATETRLLRPGAVAASQFPSLLTDAYGTITKPAGW